MYGSFTHGIFLSVNWKLAILKDVFILRSAAIKLNRCLIRPSLNCLIHFYKRCVPCRSPVLSSLRLGRQGTQLEHPTHTNSPKLKKDYTGSHIHALGWTTPQRLFILRLLRRERCPKIWKTSQSLQCSSLWNFFHPLQFVIKSVPSMCSLFNLLLSLKKEPTWLFMLSVINKLSTLTAPSMIDFFLQISTCLIWPSLHCLIHFSKRLLWLKSK